MNNSICFHHRKHVEYIQNLASKVDKKDSYEGAVTEHLRMSGIYWSITGLSLLVSSQQVDTLMNLTANNDGKPSIVDFVLSCHDAKSGGFGGNIHQDGHILYTLSAIQILALAHRLNDGRFLAMKDSVINFIKSLQQEDGSFCGDQWGEIDTRFSYCALSALSILGALRSGVVDVDKAAEYIASCQNFDGGFGCQPGAESHAGQIFCCVGALSIAQRLDVLKDKDLLCWWLCERQCDSGGLNGRPEKQADVCYSWWILSSLCILGKVDWISGYKLATFILKCQDDDDGGIADRPGDMADVFHTFFGIAGLSLLGYLHETEIHVDCDETQQYRKIDPVYALPTDVVKELGLKGQIAKRETQTDDRLSHYDIYP
jgi:geranylgeranyl transferase type-2 subunit beta